MSGTSMDGCDVALVQFIDDNFHLIRAQTTTYPDELLDALHSMVEPDWCGTLAEILRLDAECGEFFGRCISRLLANTSIDNTEVAAIGLHGQTIFHDPTGGALASSWQLGDPNRVAEATGIAVVADFRRRDMAAGGEGAPLAPAFHRELLRTRESTAAILNLGGFANVSMFDGKSWVGFDTGPANALIDAWIRQHKGEPYDTDGTWARSGRVRTELLETLIDDPYFRRMPPKSTGREMFNMDWIRLKLATGDYPAADVQATLTELSCVSVAEAIASANPCVREVFVSGGGAQNGYLMERLNSQSEHLVFEKISELGIDPDYLEAVLFAWLARHRLSRRPGNLASATGADGPRVLGAMYPP